MKCPKCDVDYAKLDEGRMQNANNYRYPLVETYIDLFKGKLCFRCPVCGEQATMIDDDKIWS